MRNQEINLTIPVSNRWWISLPFVIGIFVAGFMIWTTAQMMGFSSVPSSGEPQAESKKATIKTANKTKNLLVFITHSLSNNMERFCHHKDNHIAIFWE